MCDVVHGVVKYNKWVVKWALLKRVLARGFMVVSMIIQC